MVEREAIGHPRAPVMAEDMGRRQAEVIHQRDDVGGHLPFGIGAVEGVVGRRIALAIAAQIGDDHAEVAGEGRGDLGPAEAVFRETVQQDQRWAVACLLHRQGDAGKGDAAAGEACDFGHGQACGCWS